MEFQGGCGGAFFRFASFSSLRESVFVSPYEFLL
jgi:hypothetical protein